MPNSKMFKVVIAGKTFIGPHKTICEHRAAAILSGVGCSGVTLHK